MYIYIYLRIYIYIYIDYYGTLIVEFFPLVCNYCSHCRTIATVR